MESNNSNGANNGSLQQPFIGIAMARFDSGETRTERDPLGEKQVPVGALYGVQSARARENFNISGLGPHPAFIRATVTVKKAAAMANSSTGRLPQAKADAIIAAADEILAGQHLEHFVVDVFQAGAGTSHNMNSNEVLANRAIELLGGQRGDYKLIHPNDDVNMAQSTNDVIPTSMKIAMLDVLGGLQESLAHLQAALAAKAQEFDTILKPGRTHMQDAVPIRLGQEFGAYALTIKRASERLARASEAIKELNIGATAVGTGLNAEPSYIIRVVENLVKLTGFDLRGAENLVQATQSMGGVLEFSSAIRGLAVDLNKIANDLRLMSSGPFTGFGEIVLPPVQPGSSIMPGKVNPVMAEMLNQVCYHVIGNDTAVALAAEAGQLELNVMMPMIAFDTLESLTILKNATRSFTDYCIVGITANADRCEYLVEHSSGLATALAPYIGYDKAAALAKQSVRENRTVRELALEQQLLPKEQLEDILDPHNMTKPGIAGQAGG